MSTWNTDAPTGLLGLGWSLVEEKIFRDPSGTGSRKDDSYFLLSGGAAYPLVFTGDPSASGWTFSARQFNAWSITYEPDYELWTILREDGTRYLYGGNDSTPFGSLKGVEWNVRWRNWIGTGIADGQQALAAAWNVTRIENTLGDRIHHAYEQDQRYVNASGAQRVPYTAAIRLKRIMGPLGQAIVLQYGDKDPAELPPPTTPTGPALRRLRGVFTATGFGSWDFASEPDPHIVLTVTGTGGYSARFERSDDNTHYVEFDYDLGANVPSALVVRVQAWDEDPWPFPDQLMLDASLTLSANGGTAHASSGSSTQGAAVLIEFVQSVPAADVNPYQDRRETKYLRSVDLVSDLGGSLLERITLAYGTLGSGELGKRVLKGIARANAVGRPYAQPHLFTYYGEAGGEGSVTPTDAGGRFNAATGALFGALKCYVTPAGASYTWRHAQVQLAGSRDLAIRRPEGDSALWGAPRTYFGPDYTVVAWTGTGARGGQWFISAYLWYGGWIAADLGAFPCGTTPRLELAGAYFALVTPGQPQPLRLFARDAKVPGAWMPYEPPTGQLDRPLTASGDSFFALLDPASGTLRRYRLADGAWDPVQDICGGEASAVYGMGARGATLVTVRAVPDNHVPPLLQFDLLDFDTAWRREVRTVDHFTPPASQSGGIFATTDSGISALGVQIGDGFAVVQARHDQHVATSQGSASYSRYRHVAFRWNEYGRLAETRELGAEMELGRDAVVRLTVIGSQVNVDTFESGPIGLEFPARQKKFAWQFTGGGWIDRVFDHDRLNNNYIGANSFSVTRDGSATFCEFDPVALAWRQPLPPYPDTNPTYWEKLWPLLYLAEGMLTLATPLGWAGLALDLAFLGTDILMSQLVHAGDAGRRAQRFFTANNQVYCRSGNGTWTAIGTLSETYEGRQIGTGPNAIHKEDLSLHSQSTQSAADFVAFTVTLSRYWIYVTGGTPTRIEDPGFPQQGNRIQLLKNGRFYGPPLDLPAGESIARSSDADETPLVGPGAFVSYGGGGKLAQATSLRLHRVIAGAHTGPLSAFVVDRETVNDGDCDVFSHFSYEGGQALPSGAMALFNKVTTVFSGGSPAPDRSHGYSESCFFTGAATAPADLPGAPSNAGRYPALAAGLPYRISTFAAAGDGTLAGDSVTTQYWDVFELPLPRGLHAWRTRPVRVEFASGGQVRWTDTAYAPDGRGLPAATTLRNVQANGVEEDIVTTFRYAWQDWPELVRQNILAPVSQTRVTAGGHLVDATAIAWQQVGPADPPPPPPGPVSLQAAVTAPPPPPPGPPPPIPVPQTPYWSGLGFPRWGAVATYKARNGGATAFDPAHVDPGSWIAMSQAVTHDAAGFVLETRDATGLLQSTLYDDRQKRFAVATAIGASFVQGECGWFSCQWYEAFGPWASNGDWQASSFLGRTQLGGPQARVAAARFAPRPGAPYFAGAWVTTRAGGTGARIGFGSQAQDIPADAGGWRWLEYAVPQVTGDQLPFVQCDGAIAALRFAPVDAPMRSFVFDPLYGLALASVEPNGEVYRTRYDDLQRSRVGLGPQDTVLSTRAYEPGVDVGRAFHPERPGQGPASPPGVLTVAAQDAGTWLGASLTVPATGLTLATTISESVDDPPIPPPGPPATGPAALAPTISACFGRSVVIASGDVLAWGNRAPFGAGPVLSPEAIPSLDGMVAVAAAQFHSVALGGDGHVRAWGSNEFGQLGDGTKADSDAPVPVLGIDRVLAVAAGRAGSVALRADGTVWVWGGGRDAIGTWIDRTTPEQVPGLAQVTAISSQGQHVLALRADGTVWAFGDNDYGQIGDGTTRLQPLPVRVPGLAGIAAISAGLVHSLAIAGDGSVWAWGSNAWGELGTGGTAPSQAVPVRVAGLSDVVAIAACYQASAALRRDGTVWAWGSGAALLGQPQLAFRSYVPVRVGGLTNIIRITGGSHLLALAADGTLWAWGSNDQGQLGDGTTTMRSLPQRVRVPLVQPTETPRPSLLPPPAPPPGPRPFALRFTVPTPAAGKQPGEDVVLAIGGVTITGGADRFTVAEAGAAPATHAVRSSSEWLAVVTGRRLTFFAGQRMVCSLVAARTEGDIVVRAGTGTAAIADAAILHNPMVQATYVDGLGRVVQTQHFDAAGAAVVAVQTLYDGWGGGSVRTLPATRATVDFAYCADLVTSFDWTSGRLDGRVRAFHQADGAAPGQLADDPFYAYTRLKVEASPLARPARTVLPGARFQADALSARQAYGRSPEAMALLEELQLTATTGLAAVTSYFPTPEGAFRVDLFDREGRAVAQRQGAGDQAVATMHVVERGDGAGTAVRYGPSDFFNRAHPQRLAPTRTTVRLDGGRTRHDADLRYDPTSFVDRAGRTRLVAAETARWNYSKFDAHGRTIEAGVVTVTDAQDAQAGIDASPRWPALDAKPAGDPAGYWTTRTMYDTGPAAATDTRNNKGRVTQVVHRDGQGRTVTERFRYDAWGNLVRTALAVDAVDALPREVGYTFNVHGRVREVEYPPDAPGQAGARVRYEYNTMGQVARIGTADNPSAYAVYAYDVAGRMRREWLHGGTIACEYRYDFAGHLRQITYAGAGGVLFDEAIAYDDAQGRYLGGRVAQASFRTAGGVPYAWQFAYDGQGRLASATTLTDSGRGIAANPAWDVSGGGNDPIQYDANGNLSAIAHGAERTQLERHFFIQRGNRIEKVYGPGEPGVTMIGYDDAGRMLTSPTCATITYDAATSQPVAIVPAPAGPPGPGTAAPISLLYSGSGRRVLRDSATTGRTLYIHGAHDRPVVEETPAGHTRYVHGPGGLLARVVAGVTTYPLKDHVGSTRVVATGAGAAAAHYNYFPFGGLMPGNSSTLDAASMRYLFSGQERDPETGLYLFPARPYDPALASFYTPDPADEYFSPYTYVGNDPVNRIDPTGTISLPVLRFTVGVLQVGLHAAVGAFAGAVFAGLSGDDPETGAKWGTLFALAGARRAYIDNVRIPRIREANARIVGGWPGARFPVVLYDEEQIVLHSWSGKVGAEMIAEQQGIPRAMWRTHVISYQTLARGGNHRPGTFNGRLIAVAHGHATNAEIELHTNGQRWHSASDFLTVLQGGGFRQDVHRIDLCVCYPRANGFSTDLRAELARRAQTGVPHRWPAPVAGWAATGTTTPMVPGRLMGAVRETTTMREAALWILDQDVTAHMPDALPLPAGTDPPGGWGRY